MCLSEYFEVFECIYAPVVMGVDYYRAMNEAKNMYHWTHPKQKHY